MAAIAQDIKSIHEGQRLHGIKILGLIPGNNQISTIENMLVHDPSLLIYEALS